MRYLGDGEVNETALLLTGLSFLDDLWLALGLLIARRPAFDLDTFRRQSFSLARAGLLSTLDVIHSYPRKRVLVTGFLDGHPVVAKFYVGGLSGWWEWYRGLRGTRALLAAGVLSPQLRYAGFHWRTGAWLTVVDRVQTDEPWPPLEQPMPEAIHRRMLAALASHHRGGIVQNDLNPNNFLPAEGRLYSIDGDRIRRYSAPLTQRRVLANLCRFYAYKSGFDEQHVRWGYLEYCRLRERAADPVEEQQLVDAVLRQRREVAERVARRSLKGWKFFRRWRAGATRFISDGRVLPVELQRALAEPAAALAQARKAPVGRHYRLSDDLTLRLRRIGAKAQGAGAMASPRQAWFKAMVAARVGIPVERPVAVVEQRHGLFGADGYLLQQPLAQQRLGAALPKLTPSLQEQSLRQVGQLLARMRGARLSHDRLRLDAFGWDGRQVILLDVAPLRLESAWAPGFIGRWQQGVDGLRDELAQLLGWGSVEVAAALAMAPANAPEAAEPRSAA